MAKKNREKAPEYVADPTVIRVALLAGDKTNAKDIETMISNLLPNVSEDLHACWCNGNLSRAKDNLHTIRLIVENVERVIKDQLYEILGN